MSIEQVIGACLLVLVGSLCVRAGIAWAGVVLRRDPTPTYTKYRDAVIGTDQHQGERRAKVLSMQTKAAKGFPKTHQPARGIYE